MTLSNLLASLQKFMLSLCSTQQIATKYDMTHTSVSCSIHPHHTTPHHTSMLFTAMWPTGVTCTPYIQSTHQVHSVLTLSCAGSSGLSYFTSQLSLPLSVCESRHTHTHTHTHTQTRYTYTSVLYLL